MGSVIQMHGYWYKKEYDYSIAFESYVAKGFHEFYSQYDASKDCVWVCEHKGSIIGFLLLMHRKNHAAQLRFFIILPDYRGLGLGKKLMELFMRWLKEHDYRSSYLWTTHEQITAAALYKKFGFELVEEKDSTAFGKLLKEHRYEFILQS